MKKKIKKLCRKFLKLVPKKRLTLSLLVAAIALTSTLITFGVKAKYKADYIDDASRRYCAGLLNDLYKDSDVVPKKLEKLYGKAYSTVNPTQKIISQKATQITGRASRRTPPVQMQASFILDFDTYGDSWKNFPTTNGKTGAQARDELKNLSPEIINQIKSVYGEPFKNNKITVVYDQYFEDFNNPNSLNEWKMGNSNAQYRNDLDLIIIGKTSANTLIPSFIHELVHGFNDGNLLVDNYEEGLAESVTKVAAEKMKVGSINQADWSTFFGRDILANPAGLIRTLNNGQIISDRYSAAAKMMYELYSKDNNFYKKYREKLKASPYYASIARNPNQYMAVMITDSACGELTDRSDTNALVPFMRNMQKYLVDSGDNLTLSNNPIFNINPESKLYIDSIYKNNQFYITGSFKYSSVVDILLALYQNQTGDLQHQVHRDKLMNAMNNIKTMDLSLMASAVEQPADRMEINFAYKEQGSSNPKYSQGSTKKITKNAFSNGTAAFSLADAGVKNDFTGTVKVDISSYKKAYRGRPTKDCNWMRVCIFDGIQSNPFDAASTKSFSFNFYKGQLVREIPDVPSSYSVKLNVEDFAQFKNGADTPLGWEKFDPDKAIQEAYVGNANGTGHLIIISKNSNQKDAYIGYLAQDLKPETDYILNWKARAGSALNGNIEIGYITDSGQKFSRLPVPPIRSTQPNQSAYAQHSLYFTTPEKLTYNGKAGVLIALKPLFYSNAARPWIDISGLQLFEKTPPVAALPAPTPTPTPAPAKPSSNFSVEKKITFSDMGIKNSLDNFPLYFTYSDSSLKNVEQGGKVISGKDIAFTDENGKPLDFEIEKYNEKTGTLSAWVTCPKYSSASSIKLVYGKNDINTFLDNRAGVWKNYAGVWHMDNASLSDAASKNLNGKLNEGASSTTGLLGGAVKLNGKTGYVDLGNSDSLRKISGSFTTSFWFKYAGAPSNKSLINTLLNKNYLTGTGYLDPFHFYLYSSENKEKGALSVRTGNKTAEKYLGGSLNFSDQKYHFAAFSFDTNSGIAKMYIDGVEKGSTEVKDFKPATDTDSPLTLGVWYPGYNYFNGIIDEVKISNSAKSGDWVKAEYLNQYSPAKFYSVK